MYVERRGKHGKDQLPCTSLDQPYLCPSGDEIGRLINASLRWEKELMPSMDDEAYHSAGLMEHLANKKFRNVNAEGRLQLSECALCKSRAVWGESISFFAALERTSTICTTHEGKNCSHVYAIVLRWSCNGVQHLFIS